MQNKGAMDTDQVIDVPDTPDRLAALNINHGGSVGKGSATSVARDNGNSNFLLRGRSRVLPDNQHDNRLHLRSHRSLNNPEAIQNRCNPLFHLSHSPPVVEAYTKYQRTAGQKPKHDIANSFGGTHVDKGKTVCQKPLTKKSTFQEGTIDLDSMEQTAGCSRTLREGSAARNVSLLCMPNSSNSSSISHKGKGMACDNTGRSLGIDHWKGIDLTYGSPQNGEKFVSAPIHSFNPPRITGQKRLVRNGCISPLNIAKAKQLPGPKENDSASFKAATNIMVSRSPSRVIDISDSSAECNKRDWRKGKGVVVRSTTPRELVEISRHSPGSSTKPNADVIEDNDANAKASVSSDDLDGWRNTGNRSKKNDPHMPNAAKTLTKRQKKHEGTSCNHGEYSAPSADDSEIMFPGSSVESSNSKSKRNLRSSGRSTLGPLVEVDELLPEVALVDSHRGPHRNPADSEARARQLEADEILALELQQQLYQESPVIVGGGETDAHIARALQQEDATQRASSSGTRGIVNSRRSSISAMQRQQRPRSLQNPSLRTRLVRAQEPTSGRMAQLRGRVRRQTPSNLPRGRDIFPFPLDMDLDVRLDILEALEAAVGDFGDMTMQNHGLHTQRDFNENDYEMLLALDENNHRHGGARVDQINRLPQSVVQSDNNLEEACAICLETPTTGETIRHLPCFHKFHKDCIDPWLSRKTSCPVCKSSIT